MDHLRATGRAAPEDALPYVEPAPGAGDPAAAADLDARLAGALERVGHALRVSLWEQAKAHGLSPVQVQLLGRLASDPPARRRVGQLAAELDVTAPTISDAVGALRRKGLVTSTPSPLDARAQLLDLTAAGHELAARATTSSAHVTGALAPLDPSAKADALALLVDVIGALHAGGVISVARACTTCRFFRRSGPAEGSAAVHHCALMDAPLPAAALRVDCREHEPLAA